MKNYFKQNKKILLTILALVFLSGPVFSIILSILSNFLEGDFGDWIGYYGTIGGIVISLVVVHLQWFMEREKDITRQRPALMLENDYQVIKAGTPIYYNDKYWYSLIKGNKNTKKLGLESFQGFYNGSDKRDKVLTIEILNNQPLFNLQIKFGDSTNYEIIPKLSENQRIYVVSKEHQKAIFSHLINGTFEFDHVPEIITLYYTTLSGETIKAVYSVDDKGYCSLKKEEHNVAYPTLPKGNHLCDYFVKN